MLLSAVYNVHYKLHSNVEWLRLAGRILLCMKYFVIELELPNYTHNRFSIFEQQQKCDKYTKSVGILLNHPYDKAQLNYLNICETITSLITRDT